MDNAFNWAAKHNKLRVSEIHGEEEGCLCLSDTFQLLDETGQEIAMNGELEVDEPFLQLTF